MQTDDFSIPTPIETIKEPPAIQETVTGLVYTFKIKNIYTHPLVILDAYPSCSCLKVSFDKSPVNINEDLNIYVFINNEDYESSMGETIIIKCNKELSYKLNITSKKGGDVV